MHSMPLQSLPDVVNREILSNMTPSEIFLASMTSKKTKRLIKRNIYKVDEVGVEITVSPYEIRAAVYIKIRRKICNVVILHFRGDQTLIVVEDRQVFKEYQFLKNIGFIPTSTTSGCFDSRYVSTRREIHSIHSHVCDVFNINASNLSVRFPSYIHPECCDVGECFDVGTVKKCTMTDVGLESVSSIKLFNKQKNMNLLIVENNRQNIPFGSRDYYRHVPSVILRNAQTRTNMLLTRFQGQHALLENCFLTGFYVKAFLKIWSENKMENLISMIAYQSAERLFNHEKVLEVLEEKLKHSGANTLKALRVEKPLEKRIYPYESIITQEHQFEADTFDCDGGYDVVRNSDGKRATIKISKDYFMFFVCP